MLTRAFIDLSAANDKSAANEKSAANYKSAANEKSAAQCSGSPVTVCKSYFPMHSDQKPAVTSLI